MTSVIRSVPASVLVGLLAVVFAANVAHAQKGSLKIGVVNVQKLLQEAPQAKKAMQSLQQEFAPRQRDLVAKQKDLQKKQTQFKRDAAVMSDEERNKLQQQIQNEQRDLQRSSSEFREDLNVRQNEEVSKLQKSLLQQVQDYARDKNYDLVVGDALYFSNAVDITQQVLDTLEKSASAEKKDGK
jgi:outer membrane protein